MISWKNYSKKVQARLGPHKFLRQIAQALIRSANLAAQLRWNVSPHNINTVSTPALMSNSLGVPCAVGGVDGRIVLSSNSTLGLRLKLLMQRLLHLLSLLILITSYLGMWLMHHYWLLLGLGYLSLSLQLGRVWLLRLSLGLLCYHRLLNHRFMHLRLVLSWNVILSSIDLVESASEGALGVGDVYVEYGDSEG